MHVIYNTEFGQEVEDPETQYELLTLVESLVKRSLKSLSNKVVETITIDVSKGKRLKEEQWKTKNI
jgi:hypothetical protein